jgi:hypothetical protein
MLVELMPETPERQHRTQAYPHLLGAAKLLGWEATWQALGVRYDPTLRYGLPPADLKLLLAEIKRRAPSVVVINEQLIVAQQAAVKAAAPNGGARLVYCSLGENFVPRFPDFVRGLGAGIRDARLDDPGLIEGLEPDFNRAVLNAAPWAPDPLIRVVVGARCSYRTRVDENPFYRGLKLSSKTMGCTFCATPPDGDCLRDVAAFAAGQVAAACRQRARPGAEIRIELIGARLWRKLEEFLTELPRSGARGAELSFMPRIDEILDAREAIRRCLPLLAKNALALRFYGTGVENFSPDENLRMNKGITAAQVHEATAFIMETSARWPGHFRFPVGSLGMILFTPWTTLQDIRVNIENIERCPLILARAATGARLQLFQGREITVLAEKDGLIVKKSDADFYNPGCIVSADQNEIPWRFAHPQVAALCELGRELYLHDFGPARSGPKALSIAALVARETALSPRPLAPFLRGLEALARDPKISTLPELLDVLHGEHRWK